MSSGEELAVKLLSPVMNKFRTQRMNLFTELMRITPETAILDVGGSERNWNYLSFAPNVTILNIIQQNEKQKYKWIYADAREIPFPDRHFDVVFSNSMVEHLSTFDNQVRAANEIRRVGKKYFVQTPNLWFPIDVHMLLPCFHWLPKWVQRHTAKYITPWGWIHRPTQKEAEMVIEEITLLTKASLKKLFPDAEVYSERVCGITKSLIAVSGK